MLARTFGLVLLLGVLVNGCAPRPHDLTARPISPADESGLLERDFRAAPQILAGFDPPESTASWRPGDQMLYGLLLNSRTAREVRLVRVTVKTPVLEPGARVLVRPSAPTAPSPAEIAYTVVHREMAEADGREFTAPDWKLAYMVRDRSGHTRRLEYKSGCILAAVDVYDENAALRGTSFLMLPEAILRSGLYDMATRVEALQAEGAGSQGYVGEAEDWVQLLNTLMSLSGILWQCPELAPVLKALQPRPSVWSLLLHPVPTFTLELVPAEEPATSQPLPTTMEGQPVVRLPLLGALNGDPALRCDLLVMPALPPVQPCAGVFGIDASRLQRPETHVHVRLVAARRGAP